VTKCFGTFKDPIDATLAIVMDLCDQGDLIKRTSDGNFDILAGSRMSPLPHAEMVLFALDMFLGLAYIHNDLGMIHRDLAARNVMLKTEKGVVVAKLADLGMAREVDEDGHYGITGTRAKLPIGWCSPEILEKKVGAKASLNASPASDMWSSGVTISEMVTNCSAPGKAGPYLEQGTILKANGATHLTDIAFIRKFITDTKCKETGVKTPGGRLHIPDECPAELRVLMKALWSCKKKDRPTAVQCVAFLLRACAPLLGEAKAWEADAESAAKIKQWICGDLGIDVPRAAEVFGDMNYEVLVDDEGLLGDFKTELGDAFVLGETFKAMRREIRALKSLNKAVEQEPLKSALAKACEDAEKETGGEAMQASLGEALKAAREETTARNKKADEDKEEKEGKGDDGDDDAVPLSPFSLEITAKIDAEKAKGADMDFAMMGQLKKVDLPAARALDIAAHKAQLACAVREAEVGAQLAAAMEAEEYELCAALQGEAKEAAAQLEKATDARAKAWAALGRANADAVSGRSKVKQAKTAIIGLSRLEKGGKKQAEKRAEEAKEADAKVEEERVAELKRKAEEEDRERVRQEEAEQHRREVEEKAQHGE
jgi:hypothetical protein